MKPDFDVLIAGGGMVGAGLAALLATHRATEGLKVAILEQRPATAPSPGEPLGLRVSALSRASQRLLERTGAWPQVLARGASPYRRMTVWDEAGSPEGEGSIHFDAAEYGEQDLGHIAENRAIQLALTARALEHGVTLLRAGVEGLTVEDEAVEVATGDGRRLTASLLVAADGSDSTVRRLAGIATRGWEYGQHGVVAHLRPERSHAETAWQRFLHTGPLALLPLADGRVSIVWSTTPEQAKSLVEMDEDAFGREVTAASAHVLGTLKAASPRASFPLRLRHAEDYTRPRIALIGDAAHAVHPLAGQGVNLGFMDCAALAEVVGEAIADGTDPGERRVLRRYERWRKAENLPAMAAFDGLKRLFSNDDPMLSWIRRSGLGLVDRAPPLKRLFISRALGLSGDVPTLVRRGAR
jgi:2-octaprenylphenol hydroxylase